ncbi:MAG: hypothetical protein ACYSYT_04115 [Planctomycetota bacterium]|jgi:hypothetical protein
MKLSEKDKWLEQVILETAPVQKPLPDFEKWKQNHPQAIDILKSRAEKSIPVTGRRIEDLRIVSAIIKSRIAKFAAAAAIVAIVALSVTFLEKIVTPAYAIEQTIRANSTLRYLHFRYFSASEEEPKQGWCEFDQNGQLKNVRIDWPDWLGAELVVWKQGVTQIWSRKQKRLTTFSDEVYTARVLKMAAKHDPRLAVERLYEREKQGKVKIEVEQPSDKAKPIVVTATYLPGSQHPGRRVVLFVNQATKLVTTLELYQWKDDKYEYMGVYEYYDYNVPIDADMFNLDNEVGADVKHIDTRIQDVGLEQGDLTNEGIAAKVVGEFLQALIADDYAKAGVICGGMSAAEIKSGFGQLNIRRIISIGEPVPYDKPNEVFLNNLRVPCTIEIEENGKVQQRLKIFNVRQVLGRRGRWMVDGPGQKPQNARNIGLGQGNLSDDEIAVKVVREFLEAWIAKNYAKAGRIFGGMPAEQARQLLERFNLVRIISVGKPVPQTKPKGLRVAWTVEVEENGKLNQWHSKGPYVQQVSGMPGRWIIVGGF